MALALILLFSWLSHAVGAPLIMGGFAAGIALSQHFRFNVTHRLGMPALDRWFAPSPQPAHRLEEHMRLLIHTFAPLFFVMVGCRSTSTRSTGARSASGSWVAR